MEIVTALGAPLALGLALGLWGAYLVSKWLDDLGYPGGDD